LKYGSEHSQSTLDPRASHPALQSPSFPRWSQIVLIHAVAVTQSAHEHAVLYNPALPEKTPIPLLFRSPARSPIL